MNSSSPLASRHRTRGLGLPTLEQDWIEGSRPAGMGDGGCGASMPRRYGSVIHAEKEKEEEEEPKTRMKETRVRRRQADPLLLLLQRRTGSQPTGLVRRDHVACHSTA